MKHNKFYPILRQFTQGKLPTEFREVIKRWLVSKEEAEEKEAAVRHIWNETHALADESTEKSLHATYLKIKEKEKVVVRSQRGMRFLRYAAFFLLPVISGLSVWLLTKSYSPEIEMITCYVSNGKQQIVELSDGSEVQLNAGSVFIYPKEFTQKKREVFLVGEANFSVAKNEDKPFFVHIKSLNIEVVGTKFNVESYPESDRITTTLEQGSIIVHDSGETPQTILMQPDEQLIYYEQEMRFEKKQVRATSYRAWTHGELYFSDKTMHDIVNSLERHFNVNIQFDPQLVGTDLYTMRIRSRETLENALYIFTQIVGNDLTFRQQQDHVYLFPQKKEVNP